MYRKSTLVNRSCILNVFTESFWSVPIEEVLKNLKSTRDGLDCEDARQRLQNYGRNELKVRKRTDSLFLFLSQFKSPITLILILAAILSFFLHDSVDALIILVIVFLSGSLGFWQERGAADAVKHLLAKVEVKSSVKRDAKIMEIPMAEVVPGDIVLLTAGDGIPGDCLLIEQKELCVDESTLTGETFPVEKSTGVLPAETALANRTNTIFMGTHVISGSAAAVVVGTGKNTEIGKISEKLRLRPPETQFQSGVRRFGYLLMEITLLLVIIIFAANVYLHRPVFDSFLFSLGLAVGLTPQLLPAIISINLAQGAKRMAQKNVIVKRLESIENFGSMNILCSDKTGTLTEGIIQVHAVVDAEGKPTEKALFNAYLNACYQTGYKNPIDDAIRAYRPFDISQSHKLDELPYDFIRKRLSVLISIDNNNWIITKGAISNVLEVCKNIELADGKMEAIDQWRQRIQKQFEELSRQGFRVLGIASATTTKDAISKEDEYGMTFLGLLVLFDPPKAGVLEALNQLEQLGIKLKMITGDNRYVANYIMNQAGFTNPFILTGSDLRKMSNAALVRKANEVDVFAEVDPNQKERIIMALKQSGNVVGYMGDGINDATALHCADVGLSVNTAVDVAKEAADMVLLQTDLGVLAHGIQAGRTTFANTLKYVFMATSANFGNMFSMAGASLFLPFLPLLPKQILLTNLLTDFPEMTIASDSVDPEMVERPHRWDVKMIRRFMVVFGITSSVFDYLTFGVLLLILHANTEQFRVGWFIESVLSASFIVLVIRTKRPFLRSRPAKALLLATVFIAVVTVLIPYVPHLGKALGFEPLPASFFVALVGILVLYVITADVVKKIFYRSSQASIKSISIPVAASVNPSSIKIAKKSYSNPPLLKKDKKNKDPYMVPTADQRE